MKAVQFYVEVSSQNKGLWQNIQHQKCEKGNRTFAIVRIVSLGLSGVYSPTKNRKKPK
jgi:hypothetical protein